MEQPEDEREKESRRWFRGLRQWMELADCECDTYGLFRLQSEHEEEGLELLVRMHLGRQCKVWVRCTQLRTEMLRALRDQPDFLRRVRVDWIAGAARWAR